jgi:hypothetical protein
MVLGLSNQRNGRSRSLSSLPSCSASFRLGSVGMRNAYLIAAKIFDSETRPGSTILGRSYTNSLLMLPPQMKLIFFVPWRNLQFVDHYLRVFWFPYPRTYSTETERLWKECQHLQSGQKCR